MQLPKGLPVDTVLLILYKYLPNKGAATAAVVLYAIMSVLVTAMTVKTRAYYMLLVALTAFLELAGWGTRLVMLETPEMTTYIVHQALLIISPVLLAIVEYMTLSKLLALPSALPTKVAPSTPRGSSAPSKDGSSDQQPPLFSKLISWCFTASDILCLLLQSSGGAMYSNPDKASIARILLLIGLGAQLVFFSAFIVLTVFVQCSKRFGFRDNHSYRPVFICLYATTLLMHLRNAFRVAEFSQGFEGDLATHEMYLYIFDFMPLYACFLFFTFMHYGLWLGPGREHKAADEAQSNKAAAKVNVLHVHCM